MLGVLVLVGRGLPRGGGGGGGGWYPAPMALSRAVLFVWSTLKCGQRDVAPKTVKVITGPGEKTTAVSALFPCLGGC